MRTQGRHIGHKGGVPSVVISVLDRVAPRLSVQNICPSSAPPIWFWTKNWITHDSMFAPLQRSSSVIITRGIWSMTYPFRCCFWPSEKNFWWAIGCEWSVGCVWYARDVSLKKSSKIRVKDRSSSSAKIRSISAWFLVGLQTYILLNLISQSGDQVERQ